MKRNPIRVDIILCCYSQEQYIAKAVESVLAQDTEGLECRLIVADDCSPDSTLEIIRSYEQGAEMPFVYLKAESNIGFHANYKRAFEACGNADFVAILEGDDFWHSSDHLKQNVGFLLGHRRFSMSFNNIRVYSTAEDKYSASHWPYPKPFWHISLKQQITGNRIGNLSACVFRGNLIREIPREFFSLNFSDWELGMFMAQYGPIAILKESTSTYCVNGKGEWTKLDKEQKNLSLERTLNEAEAFFRGKYSNHFTLARRLLEEGKDLPPYMSLKSRVKKMLKTLFNK